MTASCNEIEDAIATALNAIDGLRCFTYLPDNFTPPTAIVAVSEVDYHGSFRGGDVPHQIDVMVIVGRASERVAQGLLDDYISYSGPKSVRTVIESDPTLGGVVSTSIVEKAGNMKVLLIAAVPYISVDFSMTVHA